MAPVRVVKRKWDQTISTVDTAHLLEVPGDLSVWLVPAGSHRERPSRHPRATEVVAADGAVGSGPCRVVGALRLHGCDPLDQRLQGSCLSPLEAPASVEEILWVDLDLVFEVTGYEVALRDEAEFHEHAGTMGYPDAVARGISRDWTSTRASRAGPRCWLTTARELCR